jgi:hypothetical protein
MKCISLKIKHPRDRNRKMVHMMIEFFSYSISYMLEINRWDN